MMFTKNNAIEQFRALTRRKIERLSISQGLSLLVHFYETTRASQAASEDKDGDMLLFQWGTYSWGDNDPAFDLNLTRQIIYPVDEYDQDIWQLGLTYQFKPSDSLRAVGNGEEWCASVEEAARFREYIFSTPAFSACLNIEASNVAVTWEPQ